MNPEVSPEDDISKMPLKALGLRTGMALQTRRLVEGASKKESQFFGAIESKGVMVGPMGPEGVSTELDEGEICVVRGFTGQYEFSFLSKVLQTFEKPFVYALLAYPAQVDAKKVRQSMRTKTSWPTSARGGEPADAASSPMVEVSLVDLSPQGAMIQSPLPLAPVGQSMTVSMTITFDNEPTPLTLHANVCHSNKPVHGDHYLIGMSFKGLTQHDKLLLNFATQAPQI